MLSVKKLLTKILTSLITIQTSINPVEATRTYTSQSYVTQNDWNRCRCYKVCGLVIFYFNLQVASSPGATFREIGKFAVSMTETVTITAASQNNLSTLLISVNSSGTVTIYSTSSATGFYRGVTIGIQA